MLAGASQAQDLSDAHAFVARIYAHYPVADRPHPFDPLGKDERSVFDASLIGLIAEDQRLAHGEVGALDGDPLCDCQDDGGLSFTVGPTTADGPLGAIVEVTRRDPNATPPEIEKINIVLRWVSGAWRIHDVGSPNMSSLRAFLLKANRERLH